MTERIDGFLSQKAQKLYPSALVWCDADGEMETWLLKRPGQPHIGLGPTFKAAKMALEVLAKSMDAKP